MGKDSTHVDESGNFSIEVIKKSITNMNLSATSIKHPDNKAVEKDPASEVAFICNHDSHWLTIRKIGGTWYNLNSVSESGPCKITDFYLSAFLQQLGMEGYAIFVIRGKFPQPLMTKDGVGWINASDITTKGTKTIKGGKTDFERAMELSKQEAKTDLERAIELSMQQSQKPAQNSAESQQQLQAQEMQGVKQGKQEKVVPEVDPMGNVEVIDEELARALALSMAVEDMDDA